MKDEGWPASLLSRSVALAFVSAALMAGTAAAETKPDFGRAEADSIEIRARPLAGFDKSAPERLRFGKLEWRGGLELTSAAKSFGGWSGLLIDVDGRTLVAVSDEGTWLRAELAYDGVRPVGLRNARIAPLRALDGRLLKGKGEGDAEALTLASGTLQKGALLIGFERKHRIGRFAIGSDGLSPPKSYVALPAAARRMKSNNGLEALAVLKGGPHKGSLVAFSERLTDAAGNLIGWIWIKGRPQQLAVTDIGGFDLTDAAALRDGSVLLLERRFRWTEGVKMRLRRLPAAELRSGAIIRGEVLIEADQSQEIDNMEGLAVHRGPQGEVVITMISDDNFNQMMQRTLLLQFSLPDTGLASASD